MKKIKYKNSLEALEFVSLGISMVVAILVGIALGIFLKNLTGVSWLLWIGVAIGILAALLNIKKAYDKAQKQFKELEDDPRYSHRAKYGDMKIDD
ncbi:MAG: arginine biosynthesis protein ArgJ [Campylobacteraceae bacterium 4484_166]|nr:MAG: arginine biosynthesis protein ArgJ [Campylobacteraceae bacterium 4484_166]